MIKVFGGKALELNLSLSVIYKLKQMYTIFHFLIESFKKRNGSNCIYIEDKLFEANPTLLLRW